MESLITITVKTCDCYLTYFDGMEKLTIDDFKKFKFTYSKRHVTDFSVIPWSNVALIVSKKNF